MKIANPYVYFDGNTEEAFNFYRSVFGGEFEAVIRFRDFGDNPMGVAESDLDKIAHIALPLGPHNTLMGTDHLASFPDPFRQGNNISLVLEPDSAEEAEQLFSALAADGTVRKPLQQTEWAERHGECQDRFGIIWIVDYTGKVQFTGSIGG